MEMETESAVLTEQRREIEEAKTLNSDLEFAFNLQMQEAMTASLSTSIILHQRPRHPPFPSSIILHQRPWHPPPPPPKKKKQKLEQERKDREESEHLMREMREDLDRRIHDQKVASEIMNIPDDEWEKYGDNYVDPFENGQRVSFFKVFCKGVESEERIRDMKVIVGGIGVAICDSKDNLIFKVSKGIDVGAEGSSSNKSCAGVSVELQALIEGLNAAFALDLKYLTFFVDHSMLYQYVTVLVACSDIQFAFRFAKDAIVSQITWPADNGKGKGKLKETCVICYEDTDVYQIFSVDGCFHRYCFPCMKQHVEVKLLEGTTAKCPHEGCKSEVSIETCGKFLDPKLVEIMSQRKKETSIAVTEKVYCPYPRCSALMSKSELLEYTNSSFVGGEKCGARKCVKCHYFFCINCRVPWHYNMTCYDYKISKPHPRTEDKMLDSLAKRNRWRQCVMCKNMVELAEGCYHITCRCGYEFCYTCGAKWKNKKPTCSCPIWDERNIIRDR
ncbi:pentatricopeptide repeat-containing protein [Salix suchowensis]|nr:pentatricopeptide repeat-containing protein [Salix suchowensis]